MTDEIAKAVSILKSGGLVAFPTETVYGLGADATNPKAIEKIFTAKGRPPTNPLIVHVANLQTAKKFAADWPLTAHRLALQFWPGPLTLVLPKAPAIVDQVTAGKPTVGLRAPNHPLAFELLKKFNGPLAAPSANRSTHVSPTTAQHVRDELGDAVDLILDGGPCTVGIESTILDLTTSPPTILRPGAITREQIEAIVGPVQLFTGNIDPSTPASSPGQHEIHYAPRTRAFRFESPDLPHILNWLQQHPHHPSALLGIKRIKTGTGTVSLPTGGETGTGTVSLPIGRETGTQLVFLPIEMPFNPSDYARLLYSTLRDLDARNFQTIFIQMPPNEPQWLAIRDRLLRATRPLPQNLT